MDRGRANEELVREHEGLVHELAREVQRKIGVADIYDDLVQHGHVGLLEAGEKFDPDVGTAFSQFAHHRVRGAIWDGVRRMQHLPPDTLRYARAAWGAANAAQRALEDRDARGPASTLDSAGGALESLMGRVTAAILLAELDAAPATPEANLIRETEMHRVRRALDALPEREQIVLRGVYFEDLKLDDVGKKIGLGRSGTSRVHTHALGLLRDRLG